MKLILSVDSLEPALTGIGRYTWELTQRLPHIPEVESTKFFRNGHWVKEPRDLVFPPHPSRQKPSLSFIRPSSVIPRGLKDLYLGRACRGQLFHGTNYFLPPHADIGVITVHDLSVFKFPETHPVERIKQFENNFYRSIARAAHLITDSEATRQELMSFLSWPEDKVTAVPLGVSPTFKPLLGNGCNAFLENMNLVADGYVLCVSTLEPRKKVDCLLSAYRALPVELRQRYPLILAGGSGWLSESLHHAIDRYSHEGWLRYIGFVPEDELPSLYAGARLFVYPSIYEGFGLPVLEAMASGVPVVASNRSSLPEVSQGAASLVDPEDITALAHSIEQGLCDLPWRAIAKEAGLAVAKNNTWTRCANETFKVYQQALAGLGLS